MMRAPALKLTAMVLIASCAYIKTATAQTPKRQEPATSCLDAKTVSAVHLYGVWQVSFTNPPVGMPASAELVLGKHEELADSVAGEIRRESVTAAGHLNKAAIAGDVDDGVLLLDESSDGVSISAVWNGELVQTSCGREVKGVWRDTTATTSTPTGENANRNSNLNAAAAPGVLEVFFRMVKRPGW